MCKRRSSHGMRPPQPTYQDKLVAAMQQEQAIMQRNLFERNGSCCEKPRRRNSRTTSIAQELRCELHIAHGQKHVAVDQT